MKSSTLLILIVRRQTFSVLCFGVQSSTTVCPGCLRLFSLCITNNCMANSKGNSGVFLSGLNCPPAYNQDLYTPKNKSEVEDPQGEDTKSRNLSFLQTKLYCITIALIELLCDYTEKRQHFSEGARNHFCVVTSPIQPQLNSKFGFDIYLSCS